MNTDERRKTVKCLLYRQCYKEYIIAQLSLFRWVNGFDLFTMQ